MEQPVGKWFASSRTCGAGFTQETFQLWRQVASIPMAPMGEKVGLKVDGKEFTREIKVSADPEFPAALLQEELEEETRKQRREFIE